MTTTRLSYIPVTVESPSSAPPDVAFAVIAPIDLELIFHGWGPFPAVRGVDNQSGSWDQTGRTRNPILADGSTALERLTEYTSPHSFAYELTGFTNTLRFVVNKVRGEWTMTPQGDGSIIRWTYAFHPKPRRRWLLRWVVTPLWRRYASQALHEAVASVETASGSPAMIA